MGWIESENMGQIVLDVNWNSWKNEMQIRIEILKQKMWKAERCKVDEKVNIRKFNRSHMCKNK